MVNTMLTYAEIFSSMAATEPDYLDKASMLVAGIINSLEKEATEEAYKQANYLSKSLIEAANEASIETRSPLLSLAQRLDEYVVTQKTP